MKFTSTIHKALLLAGISSSLAFGLEDYSGPNPVDEYYSAGTGFLNKEGKTITFAQSDVPAQGGGYTFCIINFAGETSLQKHSYGEKADDGTAPTAGQIIGKSSNGKIESDGADNLTIVDQSLINMEIFAGGWSNKTFTLTNVTLENFQITNSSRDNTTFNASDLTLNLSVSDLGRNTAVITNNPYGVPVIYDINLKDSLTLDFYMTDAEAQSFAGGVQAIILTGITSLDNIDGNVDINFKNEAGDIVFTGMNIDPVSLDSTGNMIVNFTAEYIPEPSTASLSLLALAGFLARRRRKAA